MVKVIKDDLVEVRSKKKFMSLKELLFEEGRIYCKLIKLLLVSVLVKVVISVVILFCELVVDKFFFEDKEC